MNPTTTNPLISTAAMVVVLALSFGLDRLILFLREFNARTAAYIELTMISNSLAHLLLAVMLLALFTWMVLRAHTSRLVAWIYLLVGLGISLYPVMYFTPLGEWLRWPMINVISMRTFFITAGSFIAVIGAAALWRNQRREIATGGLVPTE